MVLGLRVEVSLIKSDAIVLLKGWLEEGRVRGLGFVSVSCCCLGCCCACWGMFLFAWCVVLWCLDACVEECEG
ncbi:MAG: hypothetical protein DRN03_06525 [Thermoplasmata archaeon]|nr:MAG: hypothetical protein DRN03_06525 [Thermoplasmata archaeon]